MTGTTLDALDYVPRSVLGHVGGERSDAELLRNQLYARVGRAQLTELLLAIDGETHFSWELLGRPPAALGAKVSKPPAI
jgi:hypothetical protein